MHKKHGIDIIIYEMDNFGLKLKKKKKISERIQE